MSRTLHVIDQPGVVAEAAVLRLSADAARLATHGDNEQHAWLLFGGEATRDAARAIGLRDEQVCLLPKPTGLHKLLPASLAKPKHLLGQAHRVVCWTEGAAQIASLLGCAHVLRRVQDATLSRLAHRITQQASRDAFGTTQQDRAALRERWGVDAGTRVIVLIGDRFDRINTSDAMMGIALAQEALRAAQPGHADVRLLCHPLTNRRPEASELSGLLSFDCHLIQEEAVAMPWSVLPACDAALCPLPEEAGLSILWANVMGVPVLAPGEVCLPLLDELEHLISTRSRKPGDMADALTQWVSRPSL
ncbi:MAG: hypothetical protein KTR15_06955 [Phycisphaeraceae bacterium]|nr:hypothetical protein [Phycisphaeraceae bacterium]